MCLRSKTPSLKPSRRPSSVSWPAATRIELVERPQRVGRLTTTSCRVSPQQAKVLLQSAIKLDPCYAQAHAMLAAAYLFQFFDDLQDETLAASLESAERAVLLDDENPYGHSQVGMALMF